jgi:hypothetical protein
LQGLDFTIDFGPERIESLRHRRKVSQPILL